MSRSQTQKLQIHKISRAWIGLGENLAYFTMTTHHIWSNNATQVAIFHILPNFALILKRNDELRRVQVYFFSRLSEKRIEVGVGKLPLPRPVRMGIA